MCCPQYCFFSCGYSICNFRELSPLRCCTNLDTTIYGGISNKMWTWSSPIAPLSISTFSVLHICRMISRNRYPTSCRNIFLRYFVPHTMWYMFRYVVCDVWRYSFMSSSYHFVVVLKPRTQVRRLPLGAKTKKSPYTGLFSYLFKQASLLFQHLVILANHHQASNRFLPQTKLKVVLQLKDLCR